MAQQPTLQADEFAMPLQRQQPLDHFIENAYRRYAVLTILDRALPDVRDGLKPVQRRILYSMHDMGLTHVSPYRKSARVVGDVLGKYHPHGDASVYDAMVRLAQDFSMRYPLVDGQGNFGSIDGDSAAAMRYTEVRLEELGEMILLDLEKNTVNWKENFDNSLKEPSVLPSRFPNLLVNGTTGIAVGMATNILPHNLGEVCDAVNLIASNWKEIQKITIDDLLKIIKGPDLPTGGLIYRYRKTEDSVVDVIRQAYETGNATIICQSKIDISGNGDGKPKVILTELPYQVQKTTVLERIAKNKDLFPGISDVRDESDFNGMRVVFEVSQGSSTEEVRDNLLSHTQMRTSLSYNAMALVWNRESGRATPKVLSLRDMLQEFILHRLDIITRRTQYELEKAEARLHILEGLLKALSMIDEVITIIRHSQDSDTARKNLIKKLSVTQIQAQAILDMPLRRLASLERKKLDEEAKSLKSNIKNFKGILASEKRKLEIVVEETTDIKERFATPRRTVIIDSEQGHLAKVTVSDLVKPKSNQQVVITRDKIIRCDFKEYRDNTDLRRPTSRATDIPVLKFIANPQDTIFLINDLGKVWISDVGYVPIDSGFEALGLGQSEKIVGGGVISQGKSLICVTSKGNIKKTKIEDCLEAFPKGTWVTSVGLSDNEDRVLFGGICSDDAHIFICSSGSKDTTPRTLRFSASEVNPQATPSARGVIAIKMFDDRLVGGAIVEPEDQKNGFVVILTEKAHIKRISIDEFPLQGRAGQGVLCWKPTPTSGFVSSFAFGNINHHINIFSLKGKRLKLSMKDIELSTRPAKGEDLASKYGNKQDLFINDSIAGMTTS